VQFDLIMFSQQLKVSIRIHLHLNVTMQLEILQFNCALCMLYVIDRPSYIIDQDYRPKW